MVHCKISVAGALGLLICGLSGGGAYAAAPRVISATPHDGAEGVDPALKEIRIEFDQAMDTAIGYSVCGGGPTFPKFIGQPKWIDQRIFAWRVKLQPDHDYVIALNCPASGRYFRSAAGSEAEPFPIRFSTAGQGAETPVTTVAENRESIAELRRLIDQRYSYRDVCGLDWDALFERYRKKLERSKSPQDFARRAGRMLAKARDLHIWLTVDGETIASYQRRVKPNFSMDVLAQTVPGWREHHGCVATGKFDDGIGYIMIKAWSAGCAAGLQAAHDALLAATDGQGIVVDVRPNSGGDELLAQRFAACFVDRPRVYSRNVIRDTGAPGGFSGPYDRQISPLQDGPTYRGRVAVLMGPVNMSSCESFLLMMKQTPNCKLIGAPSYGSSGNPKPSVLPNGVTVYLPSWKDMLPDGTLLEGTGVAPDVQVEVSSQKAKRADPVLQAALDWLRGP